MEIYELQQDFNWFGTIIPRGTLYIQMKSNPDRYECRCEGNTKTPYNLYFHTVRNNEEYFKQVKIDIDNMIWSPAKKAYILNIEVCPECGCDIWIEEYGHMRCDFGDLYSQDEFYVAVKCKRCGRVVREEKRNLREIMFGIFDDD